jgi:proteasome lid subunit RPN8/RPN11
MALKISFELLGQVHKHGEANYPEEGAGLLLGIADGEHKQVLGLVRLDNSRQRADRHNRYLLKPEDYLHGEMEASRRGLDVIGVFHSHPDHPNRPSEYDLEWALPVLSYIITSVRSGKAIESRAWLLSDDREQFKEEPIELLMDTVI